MCNNENENEQLSYQKNNQKFLANGGVQLYFSNVFDQTGKDKLPMIKYKLRKILVDFGLVQTCLEINQRLDCITIWYQDPKAINLKELYVPLRRDNKIKNSQAIELVINLEGNSCSSPKVTKGIKTYTGLTKFLFQEFIEEPKIKSMIDNDPFNQIREVIKQGNLAASVPLESILIEGVD